jgi:hypothetical protein
MLPKVVFSWIGRLVGIAAVLSSPLVARAAEATDTAETTKQARHAAPSHTHAKKKALKRGTRHEAELGKSDKADANDKSDAPEAKPARVTKREATHAIAKGDDTDVTDVNVQVTTERVSTKPLPKPSKTPLPTIAAAATAPRADLAESASAPQASADKANCEKVHAEKAHTLKTHGERLRAEKAHLDQGHGVEPRRTPIVRASLRTSDAELSASSHASRPSKRAKSPCLHAPVEVTRGDEQESLSLTKCDGSAAPLAVEKMSVLVRPGSAQKPAEPIAELAAKADKTDASELAPGIKRIDTRLVERLQLMIDHFAKGGETPKMFVVSGYRPTSKGSFHAMGRALDFRIEGVENTDLVAFCKTLDDTGCGFYPNSSFIHMDVRGAGTGHVAWIDASTPGEKPEYVAAWPPPPKPEEQDPVKILARLDELQVLPMEDAKDSHKAGDTKSLEDAKSDDADSEPGVLLKPIIDDKPKHSTDE